MDEYCCKQVTTAFGIWRDPESELVAISDIDRLLRELPNSKRIRSWKPSTEDYLSKLKELESSSENSIGVIAKDRKGEGLISLSQFKQALEHFYLHSNKEQKNTSKESRHKQANKNSEKGKHRDNTIDDDLFSNMLEAKRELNENHRKNIIAKKAAEEKNEITKKLLEEQREKVKGVASREIFKQKLVKFYQENDPTKLEKVDMMLDQFKDKEDELFSKLEKEYTSTETNLHEDLDKETDKSVENVEETNMYGDFDAEMEESVEDVKETNLYEDFDAEMEQSVEEGKESNKYEGKSIENSENTAEPSQEVGNEREKQNLTASMEFENDFDSEMDESVKTSNSSERNCLDQMQNEGKLQEDHDKLFGLPKDNNEEVDIVDQETLHKGKERVSEKRQDDSPEVQKDPYFNQSKTKQLPTSVEKENDSADDNSSTLSTESREASENEPEEESNPEKNSIDYKTSLKSIGHDIREEGQGENNTPENSSSEDDKSIHDNDNEETVSNMLRTISKQFEDQTESNEAENHSKQKQLRTKKKGKVSKKKLEDQKKSFLNYNLGENLPTSTENDKDKITETKKKKTNRMRRAVKSTPSSKNKEELSKCTFDTCVKYSNISHSTSVELKREKKKSKILEELVIAARLEAQKYKAEAKQLRLKVDALTWELSKLK